jgi:hypothetical protein
LNLTVFLGSSERRCGPFAFVTLAEDVEVAKAFDFVAYHAFVGLWNRERASMERLGVGFDFDVNRLGGKKYKGALEKEPVFVEQGIEFLLLLR